MGSTIAAVTGGELVLAGGHQVTRIFSDEPRRKPIPVEPAAFRVFCWDVARGIIHHDALDEQS